MRAARALFAKTLLVVEHANGKVLPSTYSAATAAAQLGDVTALVAGKDCKNVADEVAKFSGVGSVLMSDSAEYANLLPENMSKLVQSVQAANNYSHIVAAHTAFGKSFVPRVAATLDCQPVVDVMSIKDETTFVRPTYAGNAVATVKSVVDSVKFLTIRATNFDKTATDGSAAVTAYAPEGETGATTWKADEVDTSGKPDLNSARVVVSGGRGLKSGDNFDLLYKLADKIPNCAVGATRAVVDAGFVPNEMQVGQTGKVVAPDLYLAVGLSGAIQHLSGMKDSKVIAAINTDSEAPIFSVSDYGLVEDLFKAVPELQKSV